MFEALKSGNSSDFWGCKNPKCPHCGEEYDVNESEAWNLYEEGEHEIECPRCEKEFDVSVHVSFSYDTSNQSAMDDEESGAAGIEVK